MWNIFQKRKWSFSVKVMVRFKVNFRFTASNYIWLHNVTVQLAFLLNWVSFRSFGLDNMHEKINLLNLKELRAFWYKWSLLLLAREWCVSSSVHEYADDLGIQKIIKGNFLHPFHIYTARSIYFFIHLCICLSTDDVFSVYVCLGGFQRSAKYCTCWC